jgi:two-component system cell cycle response regulator
MAARGGTKVGTWRERPGSAALSGARAAGMERMTYKAHILVVDDGAIERQILKRLLTMEGYRVTIARDGLTALDAYTAHGADVILVDWMMPGMDGLELVQRVRAIATPVPPFVIMLTARIDRDDLVTGLTTGADEYLTKPFDRRELVARIRGGVRAQQLMRELTRRNDLLRRMAMTDPLTELPNRRALEEWLVAERRWPDGPRPFGVVIADLNRLKVINDTYGHLAGDAALREVASRLKQAVRLSDFVARYAGDEFVVGLTDCSAEVARTVADRMRALVSGSPVDLGDGNETNLSLAAGIAVYPEDGRPEDLLAIADRRLYAAKSAHAEEQAA